MSIVPHQNDYFRNTIIGDTVLQFHFFYSSSFTMIDNFVFYFTARCSSGSYWKYFAGENSVPL